jgi:hypothetical protein
VEVTTLVDSSDVSDGMQQYRVIANMDEGNYPSGSASGYSVDNIAPGAPEFLNATVNDNNLELSWSQPIDEDFAYFEILSNDNIVNFTTESEYTEPIEENSIKEFKVRAVDANGNLSESSEAKAIQSMEIDAGNNLVSLLVLDESNSLPFGEEITGIIGEGISAAQIPGIGWVGSLTEMECAGGYWLMSTEDFTLNIVGDLCNEVLYDLALGNNLVSYGCTAPANVSDAIPDEFEPYIEGIIGAGISAAQIDGIGWIGSLAVFEPTKGYWFKVIEDIDNFYFNCPEDDSERMEVAMIEMPYEVNHRHFHSFTIIFRAIKIKVIYILYYFKPVSLCGFKYR